MNHPSEAECLFKKIYYKKALIHFNNIMNKSLFKKELYNNIIKKIALCNFYLKKYDLAINFFKILFLMRLIYLYHRKLKLISKN